MDITAIIKAMLELILAAASAFAVPWLRRKTTNAEREEAMAWVHIFVAAAEQLFGRDAGKAKKDYVVDSLEEKGYVFDPVELNNMIEAAVLKLHKELAYD